MAGRTRHTPEQIIRKLRRSDELAATGIDVEEIARQLDVDVPTLNTWRKQYGGMKADDATEFKEGGTKTPCSKSVNVPAPGPLRSPKRAHRKSCGRSTSSSIRPPRAGSSLLASMVDEHTRQSVLNMVERSIPAEDLVAALEKAFALWGGPPKVLRCDNGPEFISEALRTFCENQVGIGYVPPGQPWKNGYIESFNNRVRDECVNMNEFHSLLEARVVIEDWKQDYNTRHRHSSQAYRTPNEYSCHLHSHALIL